MRRALFSSLATQPLAAFFFGGLSLGDKTLEREKFTFTTIDYAATASFDLTPNLQSATSVDK